MDINTAIRILIIIVGLGWAIYEIVQFFRRKKAAIALSNEEFNKNLRQVQLIDVRERDE